MDTNFQDKEKVIYYLSVIRDAEVNKPPQEMDKELIDASVGLLLYLQDKNDDLTPEQINEAVEKIPFVDKEKIVNIKNKNKKINKLKLLLIAAIIPIILTILVLMATADTDWSVEKKLKEVFGKLEQTPIGEIFKDEDAEYGRINRKVYTTPGDFVSDYEIDVLTPSDKFKKDKLASISYISYATGDEIEFRFENENLSYTIYMGDNLETELKNVPYTQTTINNLNCYIVDFSDVGFYQVYFNHKGCTYCFCHSNLDVIIDLIENMEEIK